MHCLLKEAYAFYHTPPPLPFICSHYALLSSGKLNYKLAKNKQLKFSFLTVHFAKSICIRTPKRKGITETTF